MAKSLVISLLSLFLVSNGPDNSALRSSRSAQTGVLQKLMASGGSVSLKVDLTRINAGRGTTDLRFNIDPNTFFTIAVFNDELRRLEASSMSLVPQGTPRLPRALSNSYKQLVLESTPWGKPFELSIRDKNTGFVFFNIEGHESQFSAKEQLLTISNGRLLLSQEFADALRHPSAAGTQAGEISVTTNMRTIEVIQVVDGEAKSSIMPRVDGVSSLVPGPDVIVGDLSGLAQFGASSGSQVGLAVGTDSCNAGAVPLNWFASPHNDHPVIPQNLYRMSGGTTNDQRFEQIGQSNVKHAFTALQDDICDLGCSPTASNMLGPGCSDPYSASLNAGSSGNNLGSRAWINPFTGAYPRADTGTPPNSHAGHSHSGPSHRILVEMSDLNTTLNTGATYYAEAQYVTPHEYAWCQSHPGECNMSNNASHRRYNVTGTTSFSFSPVGATVRQKPAITAWTDATINEIEPAPGTDGIAMVAYKVTQTSPGVWHYEYAIYNQNLDRGVQSFSVPLIGSPTLSNIGFHAPPQHPGWANDGTVGNAGYSSVPWTPTQTATDITWATQTFATNPNANAIRWGTLYNFRFDSDRPPQLQNATVGFYKTGSPIQVQVQAPSGQSVLSINDVTVTETDAGTLNANFTVSLSPASTDPVSVQFATADGSATAGTDYVSSSGTVNFTAGQTSQPVSITVNSDNLVEFNETFFVNLSNPTNAIIGDSQGRGTIDNDDVSAVLPSNFNESQITGNGLSNTTAMAVHPDGRVFVCQQTGELRVIKNNVVLPTPFTTLTVNSSGERGLLGVAFDPDYATNRFVYVYYTATTPTIHNRVSRFTANASNEDVAVAGSEVIILDLETLSATNHNGGAIHFGPDGKLYVAVGENAVPANSQSLSNRLGKILRINSDGTIPADNPTSFPNISGSSAGVNRAIWAVGLRNPFTFSFQQGTGRMHINDVGQGTWEEIDVGAAGANYGWPTCEGNCGTSGMTNPIYQYSSAVAAPCAITGGAFYNPTTPTFPAEHFGKYFFSDFCAGWMKTIDPQSPPPTGTAPDFATNIAFPVDIQVANDGSLYYLARGNSSVYRIQYFGGPTLAVDNVSIGESNGTAVANFTVRLSPAASNTVTVQYATANDSALAGSDYTSASGALTFTPGQTTQTIPVPILHDTIFESNETFLVNLSNATIATIGDAQGVGTIVDNDSAPAISINDVTVTEGNSGTTTATFTVSLSNTTTQNVTVSYATAGSTATSGVDFVAASGSATITAGSSSTPVQVTVNSDLVFEPNETFAVNLTNPTNGTIGDAQGVGTINNDDAEPTITINDATVTEGNTGATTAAFTVSLSNPSSQTITVNYATADSSANAGSDYVATSGTLTFTPGQTSQPISITVNGDFTLEPNESFNVNLSNAANSSIVDAQGVGTINNDDTQPGISINDVSVTEGNSGTVTASFTVSLANTSSETITVNYATANNSAGAGSDYVANSGTVTFTPGQSTQPINITVNGDTVFEPDETFNINLSGAVNGVISDSQGVGTITNDDSQPTIAINDVALTEGNSGTTNATFTLSLSNASSQTITANYATANNTAAAGSDYVATSGTVTFTAGQTSQSINVTVNGETTFEPDETFNVNLTSPVNATISDNQGVGTINNDDTQPSISINDVALSEGNSGTAPASFTVSLSNASSQTITVNYATADSSATAGSDYVAASGTVTFTPGQTLQTVNVTVNGDTTFEPDETFNVNLSTPANASISDGQGVGTINNNDPVPAISINDISVTEGNTGTTTAVFTISLSEASSQTVSVNYATAGDLATSGSDFEPASGVATITPGQLSTTVSVTINSDTTFELNETFFVNLSGATNATISDNQGIGTITNNDGQPTISINDVTVTEGNSGTVTATFTLTLSNGSSQTVLIDFVTANGTASSASDYNASAGTVSFIPGQLTQSINVIVNGDTVFESAETFNVNLSGAVNASIADTQGVGTITNDDTQPTISINDLSIPEGNSGTSVATFTVTLSNSSSQTITVNYATADGAATAGDEYEATSGTLTFTPGQTSQTVNVTINGDLFSEPTSAFVVNLTAPTNATILDGQGEGLISDDDAPRLATEQNSQRAIALDAVLFVRDPFLVNNPSYFGVDKRTRVILFSENMLETSGLNVTARAVDSMQTSFDLPVEFVGTLPTFEGLTQIIVRLPDGIVMAGDLQVTITARNKTSNTVLIGVRP